MSSASASAKSANSAIPAPRNALSFDIAAEERLLQDIVDEALAQGVWITRARRLRGQELVEVQPTSLSLRRCRARSANAPRHQGCRCQGAREAEMSAPSPRADLELSHTFIVASLTISYTQLERYISITVMHAFR